ncbi:DUF1330 domain-containing protein [Parapedomonas caeni]
MRGGRLVGSILLSLAINGQAIAQPVQPAQPAQLQPAQSGYLVVSGWYKDLAVQRVYTDAMRKVIRDYGYQGAVVAMPVVNSRVLEGNWAPRFMILARFPSEQDVKQFWWSDAYQEVKKLRVGQSVLDVAEINGLPGVEATFGPESAYLIFYVRLTDQARFLKEYAPVAPAVVTRHGGKFLIRAGRGDIETLEGDWMNASMVVVEFPSAQALRAFWNSDDYRRLSEIRKQTGDWSVVEILPMKR